MSIKKNVLTTALAAVGAMGLSACGGGGNDQDSGAPQGTLSRTLSAQAIDGYLVRAIAFVDLNGNGQLDAIEPRAFTDDQGYFSYNAGTDTNYCRAGAPASEAQFCLNANAAALSAAGPQALIRITGGYDSVTGEPFDGSVTLRSGSLSATVPLIASPITSLLASAGDRQAELLGKLGNGVDGNENEDFIADLQHPGLVRTALSAHKIVAVLADKLEQRYDRLGESGYPTDASGLVYTAFVNALIDSPLADFNAFVADTASLAAVLADAEAAVRALYEAKGEDEELQSITLLNGTERTARAERAVAIAAVVDVVVSGLLQTGATDARLRGAARAVEAMTKRIIKYGDSDSSYLGLRDWALAQSGAGGEVEGLGGTVDLGELIDDTGITGGSIGVDTGATIPAGALDFTSIAGSRFDVSVNDVDKQGGAILYVLGDAGASQGDLALCVRYQEADNDLNTDGMYVGGHWSRLNAHTLVFSIDVANGKRSAVIKSVGRDGDDDPVFRFDFGGNIAQWSGVDPEVMGAAAPHDDAGCVGDLDSRFGTAPAT